MQEPETTAPKHQWDPLSLEEVKQLFASVAAPWWMTGGRALDMFIGHETRTHLDIDGAVLRRDQLAFREALATWDVQIAHDGEVIPWKRGEVIKEPRTPRGLGAADARRPVACRAPLRRKPGHTVVIPPRWAHRPERRGSWPA